MILSKLLILIAFGVGFGETAKAQADQSSPEATLNELFKAANNTDLSNLGSLCDPENQNDGDTECLCSLGDNYTRERGCHENISVKEFYEAFKNGKASGPSNISEHGEFSKAEIPFVFGPGHKAKETMNMVKRGDRWYLLSF